MNHRYRYHDWVLLMVEGQTYCVSPLNRDRQDLDESAEAITMTRHGKAEKIK